MATASGMWSVAAVAGHSCAVYEPSRPHPQGFVVLYLHDEDGGHLDDKPAFMRQFERHDLRVIAPEAGRIWWTNRILARFDDQLTAERYVLGSVLDHVAAQWRIRPPGIGLLGIGMGGQGALRLAFKNPQTFPVVAAISPAIDYHICLRNGDEILSALYPDEESARQDTATLHVHPLNWPRRLWFSCDPTDAAWYESAERLRMKLAALGIPHVCDLETTGGGHSFEYFERMAQPAIDSLVTGLESERLRVL